jgi:hypothetical protein
VLALVVAVAVLFRAGAPGVSGPAAGAPESILSRHLRTCPTCLASGPRLDLAACPELRRINARVEAGPADGESRAQRPEFTGPGGARP